MDPNATDDALDRMLSGGASVDDEWRDVALFVQELQEAVPSSGLASEDLHVAAMVETAHLLAEKGDPAVRPVSNAAAPAPQVSGLPKQRRKPMKRSTRTLIRVLAPIAAVLTVFGGMAYAGALPHQVQKAVSHAAGTVGITLPSDDETQGDNNDQGEDTQGDTDKGDVVTPPADDPGDQGESSDQTSSDDPGDQGESSDQTSSDDQSENDDSQGDNNNQGEDTQGDSTDQTSGDNQGDTTQSNDQGDQGGDTQSGDGTSGGGDQQGDSQD